MRRRRGRRLERPDPLAPTIEDRWLAVHRGGASGEVLEVRKLEPGTDLRAALEEKRQSLSKEGWATDDIGPRVGFFFAERGGQRIFVAICARDPRAPLELRGCYPFFRD